MEISGRYQREDIIGRTKDSGKKEKDCLRKENDVGSRKNELSYRRGMPFTNEKFGCIESQERSLTRGDLREVYTSLIGT